MRFFVGKAFDTMLPAGWIYSLGGCSKNGELLHGLDIWEVSWERWRERDESSRLSVKALKLKSEWDMRASIPCQGWVYL